MVLHDNVWVYVYQAIGTVILPLPQKIKEKIINSLCSSTTVAEYSNDATNLANRGHGDPGTAVVAEELVDIVDNRLDWVIGDIIDGYCHRTNKWFEAKVVSSREV